ncbi:hypothetical protein HLB23_40250 [Nocardia uniformis]|uniref:DUF222 domain-containing protein n=1 Tax=Nocardia uniformis TaxID=53432 RepID=A0A849CBK2_9NOCA|nr:DUF222 domain-containing protein [Nocardia uniformis]NNH76014.1 hypothetical protein [Nocardia uniformis]
MTDEPDSGTIAGEPVPVLERALSYLATTSSISEAGYFSAELPSHLMAPFTRAIMRIEAELLLHDADKVTAEAGEPRTHSQRRHDAFLALLMRIDEQATP